MRTAIHFVLLLCAILRVPIAVATNQDPLESLIIENAPKLKQKLTLYIYCQNLTSIDCIDFRRYYQERMKGAIDLLDNDSATMRVNLYQRSVPNAIKIYGDWIYNGGNTVPLPERELSWLLDADAMKAELSTVVTQAVASVIEIKSGAGIEELVLKSLNGEEAQPTERTSPYYAIISLSGMASKSGIGAVNPDGSAGPSTSYLNAAGYATVNRVTKKTRYMVSLDGAYSKTTQPGPNGVTYLADNFSKNLVVLGIYSIDPKSRWNVALIANRTSNPGANLDRKNHAVAGIEYNLVPFRIKQPYEFRVDAGVGYSDDRMVMPNGRGLTREQYLGLGAKLFGFWLLGKEQNASVTSSISGRALPGIKGYGSASVNAKFNYQVRKGLTFSTSASYTYTKRNINTRGTPDWSNPAEIDYISVYDGGNYSLDFTISYILDKGASGLLGIDRRFN